MEKIEFKRTWCDYLTSCPYVKDVMVGEYECHKCKHNYGLEEEGYDYSSKTHNFDMSNYGHVSNGTCKCKFLENNKEER